MEYSLLIDCLQVKALLGVEFLLDVESSLAQAGVVVNIAGYCFASGANGYGFSPSQLPADLSQRTVGFLADKVHCDLPGGGSFLSFPAFQVFHS